MQLYYCLELPALQFQVLQGQVLQLRNPML